jgi:hypothetical protein
LANYINEHPIMAIERLVNMLDYINIEHRKAKMAERRRTVGGRVISTKAHGRKEEKVSGKSPLVNNGPDKPRGPGRQSAFKSTSGDEPRVT